MELKISSNPIGICTDQSIYGKSWSEVLMRSFYNKWEQCILFMDILHDVPIYRDKKTAIRFMHVEASHKEMEEI